MNKIIISIVILACAFLGLFMYNAKKNMKTEPIVRQDVQNAEVGTEEQTEAIEGIYTIDPSKSSVNWVGRAKGKKHFGTIKVSNGQINFSQGDFGDSFVTVDMTSIKNDDLEVPMNDKLVAHLKSDDFFSVANYPESEMRIKKIEKKNGKKYQVTADLKIKDVTNEVVFDANIEEQNGSVIFDARFDIDRTDWGVEFGVDNFSDRLKEIITDDVISFDVTFVGFELEE